MHGSMCVCVSMRLMQHVSACMSVNSVRPSVGLSAYTCDHAHIQMPVQL